MIQPQPVVAGVKCLRLGQVLGGEVPLFPAGVGSAAVVIQVQHLVLPHPLPHRQEERGPLETMGLDESAEVEDSAERLSRIFTGPCLTLCQARSRSDDASRRVSFAVGTESKASQIRTSLVVEPAASNRPSGLNATLLGHSPMS